MEPTSRAVIGLVIVLALAVPALVAWSWWRRGGRVLVAATLAVGVLVSQGCALAAAGLLVNRQLGFYPTWDSLAEAVQDGDPLAGLGGGGDPGSSLGEAELHQIATRGWALHPVQPAAGNGVYRDYVVTGARSKTTQKVVVWLPPGHDDAKGLPVVMVLGGAYVTTDFAVNGLHLGDDAAAQIRAGTVPPFVAVIPEVNIKMPRDTECADYPGGPLAYTWLAQDVPAWAVRTLGVRRPGPGWSVMGWSLGAYCAAKLHANDPQAFPAAAAVEGFFAPETDTTTGGLALDLMKDPELRHRSDVAWMLLHRRPPAVRLLVVSSPADPQSYPATTAFLAAVRSVPGVRPLIVDGQGHTLAAWRSTLPTVLPYLLRPGA